MTIQLNTQSLIAIVLTFVIVFFTLGYLGGRYFGMVGYVLVETSVNESAVIMQRQRLDTLAGKYNEFQPQLVKPEEPTK